MPRSPAPSRKPQELSPASLQKRIGGGDIAPLYFLLGPEELGKEEVLELLRKAVVEPATRAFNCDVLIGGELDVNDAVSRISAFPMMAPRRLVVVRRADDLEEPAARDLLPVIRRPVHTTVLVFTADKADGRRTFFSELRKAAVTAEFPLPKEKDVPGWAVRRARSLGKTLLPEAAHLLTLYVGPKPTELANEIEKLHLWTGDRREITPEDVASLVGASAETSVFAFTDLVGGRKAGAALAALRRILEQGQSPVGVLALLTRHFVLLRKARWLLDRNAPRASFAAELKVPPFAVGKYEEQARGHTDAELWAALRVLLEADDRLKSASRAQEAALCQAVARLCRPLP